MAGPAIITVPPRPLLPFHLPLLFAAFLNGIQMHKLYFVMLCVVPSGVCQSCINEDNDVLSLAFLPLLPFASPCLTKKEKAHMHILRCGREPTWSICYKHPVFGSFPSSAAAGRAGICLWRHALCFGLAESRGLVALLSWCTRCLRFCQRHGQY